MTYEEFNSALAKSSNAAREFQNFINGQPTPSASGQTMQVVNPATDAVLASVPASTKADIDAAVAAAKHQFEKGEWSKMSGAQRGRLLNKLADLVERDAVVLGMMDALSIGRPFVETQMLDLPHSIDCIRYYAGWADKIMGQQVPTPGYFGNPTLSYTLREPIGVVGAITPWNTPFMITWWKLGPALATGCTVVIKPSEETPLSALHLARLMQEVGFPDGVLNVVTGTGEAAGDALVRHPDVNKISFTGSPETGRLIAKNAADTFKRVGLELGGKSPQIILKDANLEAAIGGTAMGLFFNQGQVCAAGTRVLVHRSQIDQVAEALAGAASGIKLGDPLEATTQMGTLASKSQFDRVSNYIKIGQAEGATMLAGGASEMDKGFYVRPTIFAQANNNMRIAQEEIFGPVGTIIPFDDEEEAIAIANGTQYGLAASIWTRDISRAHLLARQVKAGAVWINCWAAIDPRLPWGGYKTSGIGRENGYSGILAFTEEKAVTVAL